MSVAARRNQGHTCSHPSNRATSQKVWHKHGAPQLGRRLDQWTNMDYFLITGPCTLSSMWSIIRAWRGFCIDFFSGKIVITSAWAGGSSTRRAEGRGGPVWAGQLTGGHRHRPPKRNSYCVEKGLWLDKKMYGRLSLVHWYIRQFSVLCYVVCISMPASWVGKYQFLCNFPFIKCFSS